MKNFELEGCLIKLPFLCRTRELQIKIEIIDTQKKKRKKTMSFFMNSCAWITNALFFLSDFLGNQTEKTSIEKNTLKQHGETDDRKLKSRKKNPP